MPAERRARFESHLLQGRPSKDAGGIKLQCSPERCREPAFKSKLGSQTAWRHGDRGARRAISRSPAQLAWQNDALGRRDTLGPSAVSVVNRAFERCYLPCTPPHKGRLGHVSQRVGIYHNEQPCSPFNSLRRGAVQDIKPALAVGHTQRFASHKAYTPMMSQPQSRESSPSRVAQLPFTQSFASGNSGQPFSFGAHMRLQPAPPSYRDVLSNAANKPRHAWGFNEVKPQSRWQNVSRISMPLPTSETMKPAFSVSNLVPASQAPPSTASHHRVAHHSPAAARHPAPPSTAPAGRLRSSSLGSDHFRQTPSDQYKPLPSNRTHLPPVPPAAPDPRPLKRSTLDLHTGVAPSNSFETFSVQSFDARASSSTQPADVSCTSEPPATGSPMNPKAQPFVPQKSSLAEASTPSHPIVTTTNVSSDSPQPAWHTPGLSSHPCIDSDFQSTPSTASPHAHLHSPALGAQLSVSMASVSGR